MGVATQLCSCYPDSAGSSWLALCPHATAMPVHCCSVCRIMAVPRAAYNNMKAAFPIGTRKMLSNLAEEAGRVGRLLPAEQLIRFLTLVPDKVTNGWFLPSLSLACQHVTADMQMPAAGTLSVCRHPWAVALAPKHHKTC